MTAGSIAAGSRPHTALPATRQSWHSHRPASKIRLKWPAYKPATLSPKFVRLWNGYFFATVACDVPLFRPSVNHDRDTTNHDWQTSRSAKSRLRWRSNRSRRQREGMSRMRWLFPGQRCRPWRVVASCRWNRRTKSRCRNHSRMPIPVTVLGM